MTTNITEKTVVVLGATMLASMGLSGVAGAIAMADQTDAPAVEAECSAYGKALKMSRVEGTFAFTQDAATSNDYIKNVFNKAASSLCASLPQYGVEADGLSITFEGEKMHGITIEEIAGKDGRSTYLIGCACASNMPGGGAIANANVSGVSFATIAAFAGAL